MTNPYYSALLENYAQYNVIAMALAGFALLADLAGLLLSRRTDSKFDRALFNSYCAVMLIVFILALAGAAYKLITGGYS